MTGYGKMPAGTHRLGPDGREDTPLWMRELCVWAQTGGSAAECGEPVRRFAEYLGVPVGFHWYRWHEIPFDNDYPHYFPTTDGFVEEVRKLRKSNVYVMPYINGRLWDTRDRGVEDVEFTTRGLSAATKDDSGQPYTEMYGSKESDGSRVSLAVMCPSTSTWQDEVNEIVARLFDQCEVSGVYIDQIAAASPKTCMDPSHGHPLGGGHWWNEGYWKMLENMRREMKPDRMLTSECNAEPFLRWFDGYLTWHWQYDGQVPVFPAVYGGAIQMFGRAYRGGETRDLALRMKSAQQLVFGEQIGWLDPRVVDQPENAEFLRQIVRLRWQLRRYFYAGEMLRPPRLSGDIPKVRADWQWQNTWWVETDALLTGAWRLPQEDKVVVIFTNVTDQRLQAKWSFEAYADTWAASQINLLRITADGPKENAVVPATLDRQLDFPPRSAWAWEISPRADARWNRETIAVRVKQLADWNKRHGGNLRIWCRNSAVINGRFKRTTQVSLYSGCARSIRRERDRMGLLVVQRDADGDDPGSATVRAGRSPDAGPEDAGSVI